MSLFSKRGGTLHLPLRSVVIDRVTGGPVRGSLNAGEEKEYFCKKKTGRERETVMGKREEEESGRNLVIVRSGMCRGGKVEMG